MQIPVLLQSENGNGFRAEIMAGQLLSAEGPTAEVAMNNLRGKIQEQLDRGARIVNLEIVETPNPWLQLVGVYKDDPYLNDYKQAIADYRQQVDEDPDRL
ncbi:MAG: hypothetical protein HY289_02930 [Planctomycetes bacterium]|nr:hypothetical protein [Planctomycetota bacterium]